MYIYDVTQFEGFSFVNNSGLKCSQSDAEDIVHS